MFEGSLPMANIQSHLFCAFKIYDHIVTVKHIELISGSLEAQYSLINIQKYVSPPQVDNVL